MEWRFYWIKLYLTRAGLPPANKSRLLGRQGSKADEDVSNIIDSQTGYCVLPSIQPWKDKHQCHGHSSSLTHLWRSPGEWRKRTGCTQTLSARAGSSSNCSWGWCAPAGRPGAGGKRRRRQGARRWQGAVPLTRSHQGDNWRTLANK